MKRVDVNQPGHELPVALWAALYDGEPGEGGREIVHPTYTRAPANVWYPLYNDQALALYLACTIEWEAPIRIGGLGLWPEASHVVLLYDDNGLAQWMPLASPVRLAPGQRFVYQLRVLQDTASYTRRIT